MPRAITSRTFLARLAGLLPHPQRSRFWSSAGAAPVEASRCPAANENHGDGTQPDPRGDTGGPQACRDGDDEPVRPVPQLVIRSPWVEHRVRSSSRHRRGESPMGTRRGSSDHGRTAGGCEQAAPGGRTRHILPDEVIRGRSPQRTPWREIGSYARPWKNCSIPSAMRAGCAPAPNSKSTVIMHIAAELPRRWPEALDGLPADELQRRPIDGTCDIRRRWPGARHPNRAVAPLTRTLSRQATQHRERSRRGRHR